MPDGHAHTKFLSIQNLLEHHKSLNTDAIVDMITQEIEEDNLQLTSDGASVLTGSNNGVGMKPSLARGVYEGRQCWCVCHRLALACSGANDCKIYLCSGNEFAAAAVPV